MSIMINFITDYVSTMIEGSKLLADLLFSEQAIYHFFYEGGWMVFLRGILRGIHIARFGW